MMSSCSLLYMEFVCFIKNTITQKKRTIPTLNTLKIKFPDQIIPLNAGLFISHGRGGHLTRVINSTELIFVAKGTLDMFEENKEFHLKANDALILFPGRKHGGLTPYTPETSFYWLHFNTNEAEKGSDIPQQVTLEKPDRMKELFRSFLNSQANGESGGTHGVLLIMQMLNEMISSQSVKASGEGAVLASKAISYITSHAFEDISTSSVAEKLNCNPDYLGRIFRKATGKSIVDMIHDLRIRKARQLLLDSNSNIDETAEECGFNDTSYFRKIFIKHTGISPSSYRKLHSGMHVNTL